MMPSSARTYHLRRELSTAQSIQLPAAYSRLCITPKAVRQMSSSAASAVHDVQSCNVAVVGAGAGGLAAAKELIEEGHNVTVFEVLLHF